MAFLMQSVVFAISAVTAPIPPLWLKRCFIRRLQTQIKLTRCCDVFVSLLRCNQMRGGMDYLLNNFVA
jgi:hypothetical protein